MGRPWSVAPISTENVLAATDTIIRTLAGLPPDPGNQTALLRSSKQALPDFVFFFVREDIAGRVTDLGMTLFGQRNLSKSAISIKPPHGASSDELATWPVPVVDYWFGIVCDCRRIHQL